MYEPLNAWFMRKCKLAYLNRNRFPEQMRFSTSAPAACSVKADRITERGSASPHGCVYECRDKVFNAVH